jgi:hypothetical protein
MSVIGVHPKNYGHHHHENDPESTADKFAQTFARQVDAYIKTVVSTGVYSNMTPYSAFIKNHAGETLRVSFRIELLVNPATQQHDIHIVWFCEDKDGKETSGDKPAGVSLSDWETPGGAYDEGRERTTDVVYDIVLGLLADPNDRRRVGFGAY